MTNEERIKQVADSLTSYTMDKTKCIIIVNNKTNHYECIKTNDFFVQLIPGKGSIKELYDILFFSHKTNRLDVTDTYKQFGDLSVFERDHYRANLHFIFKDEEYDYGLFLSRINADEMSLLISEQDHFFDSNRIEKEKADTLQEAYLFSMMVDLSNDSCINPNTTEVRSDRQDFMDIKYSDWRLMISNMFKEQDQILFLRASSPENVINSLESKPRFHIDLQMMNLQGQYAWSRLNFARMKHFSRENPRFLYTVQDISDDMNQLLRQEGITKAVEEKNEILLHADQEKTQFFANLSHEFRSPINAIMGMNEVILSNSKEENIREYAEDIKNASKVLLHLVNDVLDFSKIQAGKMEIIPVEYEMEELIKNVSNMIRLAVQNKSIEYKVKMGSEVPKRLFGDDIRIAQILTNLLSNAVKYTDKGTVTLSIQTTKDVQGRDAIEYTVEDTGRGIKPEDMEKLFSSYGRLDLEHNRRVEGTGLGIGIVTGLLEAMNSRLVVESEYGKGSRFSFVITQNYVDKTTVDLKNDSTVKDKTRDFGKKGEKKILVVDDTPINLKIVDVLLKKLGYCADLIDNGRDALEMMKKINYDVVFLDHLMPDLDGVDTLKRAREINRHYQDAVFVAMTGNISPTTRDEYLCYGFTDYIEKPIIPDKLEELLYTYME